MGSVSQSSSYRPILVRVDLPRTHELPGPQNGKWGEGMLELAGALGRELDAALEENARLRSRIAELERSAALDSTNSSKPPTSDGPGKKGRKKRERARTGRPSGGQPGHKGTTLEQAATPDRVVDHDPTDPPPPRSATLGYLGSYPGPVHTSPKPTSPSQPLALSLISVLEKTGTATASVIAAGYQATDGKTVNGCMRGCSRTNRREGASSRHWTETKTSRRPLTRTGSLTLEVDNRST